jgi:hypothetical protein
MTKLTTNEMPKTRVEFLEKWRNDRIFKARAQYSGFNVLFDCVILPSGKVVGMDVK